MPPSTITWRNLPHWFVPGADHFVTFRLAGTLPASAISHLKQRKAQLLDDRPIDRDIPTHRRVVNKVLFALYDEFLDSGRTCDWLRDPRVASLVRRSLRHFDGVRYRLWSYCVMPNHVHALIRPNGVSEKAADLIGEEADAQGPLSKILHGVKSYTAHEANKILGRSGAFWQHESYDHWVRDLDEFERVVAYIGGNPVKAGLVKEPQDWFWSSCHDRFLSDGTTGGCLEAGS